MKNGILMIMNDLLSASTITRRKAAKQIYKNRANINNPNLAHDLLKALYLEENSRSKSSETKEAIIDAMGFFGDKDCLLYILENYIDNLLGDAATTFAASIAYVRLKRKNLEDIEPILEMIARKNINLTEGALKALGYDRMVPSIKNQDYLIKICEEIKLEIDIDFYGLAAACAGWESKEVTPFLEKCLKIDDVPLNYVAKNSLKKAYVRLR